MANNYQIEVHYSTGDSFGRQETSRVLEMKWKDLDKAKAALKRIKEHYLWYDYENSNFYFGEDGEEPVEPEWHKGMEYDYCLKVELDNGNEVEFSAPWCGYFETLHSAEITSFDEDMPFDLENRSCW